MTSITTWIYAKLEQICGTISGLSVIALDVPNVILKVILALVFGFMGAAGAYLWKLVEAKLKRKKK